MISNEDRIEAARFLRGCNCCGDSYVKCSEISEALFGNKNAICNSGASLEKIADLIDRPTCKLILERELHTAFGKPITGINGYILSCGHQAVGFEKPRYCPKCGMEVGE